LQKVVTTDFSSGNQKPSIYAAS